MQTTIQTSKSTKLFQETPANIRAEELGFRLPKSSRYECLNGADKAAVDAAIYNASCERDIVRILDTIFKTDGFGYTKLVDVACEEFRAITGNLH
ncbi:hypothetical protein [Hydrogenovibrio marinus]|uniref:Uncharacterized protein n=1 Tax=Hydrogenovibrio marinus TaxID=28885 RepID=A0A066ZX13_HYDMR|nr:hypothetical protein [Hydrogenovibrio marinus]KDN94630.1 hypothetical protein EI16_12065 [Hydrogenovibrio marinus]